MKRLRWRYALLGVVLSAVPPFGARASDAPHNRHNLGNRNAPYRSDIECLTCHQMHGGSSIDLLNASGSTRVDVQNNLCLSCHNGTNAPNVKTHASAVVGTKYGTWGWACADCHDPHKQQMIRTFPQSYPTGASRTGGTSTALTAAVLTDSTKSWVVNQWVDFSLFPNMSSAPAQWQGFRVTANGATTLAVAIDTTTNGMLAYGGVGQAYGLAFGKLVSSQVPTRVGSTVQFFSSTVTNSYADNTSPYTNEVCASCHQNTCHHTRSGSAGTAPTSCTGVNFSQSHNDGLDCTGCHPHNAGFEPQESSGGSDCSSCHADLFTAQNDATNAKYHHYLNNSNALYPVVATAQLSGTGDTNRRCLMCHVDHNLFRPDINTTYGARSKNLRTSIMSAPTTSDTWSYASTDFLWLSGTYGSSPIYGGTCLGCHRNSQAKSYPQPDTTATTPAIPYPDTATNQVAVFQASEHGYGVTSTFKTDLSVHWANCAKCHDDTLNPHSSKNAQSSAYPKRFGLHLSTLRRMLAPLGLWTDPTNPSTLPSDPMEENFCYQCHGYGSGRNPNAGTSSSKDYYGVVPMAQTATRIADMLTDSIKAYNHPVTNTRGLHAPTEGMSVNWNPTSRRHVQCEDCHNPHAASYGSAPTGLGTIGNATTGVWGVSVTSYGASYAAGTATFTSGSATVSGTGTTWTTGMAGWNIKANAYGKWYLIASVASATSLTLVESYREPTSNAIAYTIVQPVATGYGRIENVPTQWGICLKCHSSYGWGTNPPNASSFITSGWTTLTWTESDVGKDFSPYNLGYHPLFAPGLNQPPAGANTNWGTSTACGSGSTGRKRYPGAATCYQDLSNNFVDGWNSRSLVVCTDCHASDNAADPDGPHGSANRWILRGLDTSITVTIANGTVTYPNTGGNPENFCLNCHRRDVYGDNTNGTLYTGTYNNMSRHTHPANSSEFSIWNNGAPGPSASNYTRYNIPCLNCHGGRSPGLIHGSNMGVGASGNSAQGFRFMTGSSWVGHTTTFTGGTCFTPSAANNVTTCTQHSGTGRSYISNNYSY